MENPIEKFSRIQPDFSFDDLTDLLDENYVDTSSIVRDVANEGTVAGYYCYVPKTNARDRMSRISRKSNSGRGH